MQTSDNTVQSLANEKRKTEQFWSPKTTVCTYFLDSV